MTITGKGGRPIGLQKTGGRKKGTPNRATVVLRDKLAALDCDPAEELVRIAQNPETSVDSKVQIYSTLLPYVYPKRKLVDYSDEERVTVKGQAISPEEALDLARDLIAVFSSRAAVQQELSTPVSEDERKPSVEEPGNEP